MLMMRWTGVAISTEEMAMTRALLVVLLLAGTSPALRAQDTTIPFDDLSANVKATDQYRSQGVVFDPQGWLPYGVVVAPGVAASGTTVANITCSPVCSNEFPVAFVRGIFQGFSRRHVRVSVGGLGGPWSSPALVTLTAFDGNGKIVARSKRTAISPGSGIHTVLEAVAKSNTIASFEIAARPNFDVSKFIAIDDLVFDSVATGGTPDFVLAVAPKVLTVLRGATATANVDLTRLNGSTGAIDLSLTGLPPGVSATFAPASVGASSAVLTLAADVGAPTTSAAASATLTATPSASAVGTAAKTTKLFVDVRSFFTVSLTRRLPPGGITLPGCTPVALPVKVVRDFTFAGPVTLRAENLPSGVHATLSPSTVDFRGGVAQSDVVLTLQADPGVAPAAGTIRIVGTGAGAPDSELSLDVGSTMATVSGASPSVVRTPRDLKPGTEVTITGVGFCPGATVQFGNEFARVAPSFVSATGDQLKAVVPRLATSGPVGLVYGDTVRLSSPNALTVQSYRNQNGYAFHNLSNIPIEFDDVNELFGDDQTHLAIDFCWPFGCSVTTPIPSPLAALFTGIARGALHDGQCYGMSLSAQRILHGDRTLASLSGAPGVSTIFSLTPAIPTAAFPGTPAEVIHYAHVQHIAQLSAEFVHHWIGEAALNVAQPSGHIRSQVVSALLAGDHPYISLRHDGKGHVVTAFNIEEDGLNTGGFYIDLYDSNFEFLTSENSDGQFHREREGYTDPATGKEFGSRIHVKSDGQWTLPHVNSEDPWVGGLDELVVTNYSVVPIVPTMPASFDGLITIIFGDAAFSAQITDAAGRRLLDAGGRVNRDPATAIAQASRFAPLESPGDSSDIYVIKREGTYTQTIVGTASASYTNAAWSPGGVTQVTTDARAGSRDVVTRLAGRPGVVFRSLTGPRAYTAELQFTGADRSQRTVVLRTTSSTEGDTVAYDRARDAVTFRHLGAPTTYTIALQWAGASGPPSSTQSAALHVARGDRVSVMPRDWTKLGLRDTEIRIEHANGRTDRTVIPAAPRQSAVAITALTVVDTLSSARPIRIASTLAHEPPRDGVLVVSWNILRGGRSVARHVAQFKGSTLEVGPRIDEWIPPSELRGEVDVVGTVTLIRQKPLLKSDVATQTRHVVLR
jgi:hypothetical protein